MSGSVGHKAILLRRDNKISAMSRLRQHLACLVDANTGRSNSYFKDKSFEVYVGSHKHGSGCYVAGNRIESNRVQPLS